MAVSAPPCGKLFPHPQYSLSRRFIFNAIMTFIVAGAGYLMVCRLPVAYTIVAFILTLRPLQVPDAPGSTSIFWMSEEDNRIALRRMQRAERLPSAVSHTSLHEYQVFSSTNGVRRGIELHLGPSPSDFQEPNHLCVCSGIFVSTRRDHPLSAINVHDSIEHGVSAKTRMAGSCCSLCVESRPLFEFSPTRNSPGQKSVKNADGSKRFSVAEINAISIPAYALMLLAMLAFAYVHSRTGWHTTWVVVQEVRHFLLLRLSAAKLIPLTDDPSHRCDHPDGKTITRTVEPIANSDSGFCRFGHKLSPRRWSPFSSSSALMPSDLFSL